VARIILTNFLVCLSMITTSLFLNEGLAKDDKNITVINLTGTYDAEYYYAGERIKSVLVLVHHDNLVLGKETDITGRYGGKYLIEGKIKGEEVFGRYEALISSRDNSSGTFRYRILDKGNTLKGFYSVDGEPGSFKYTAERRMIHP